MTTASSLIAELDNPFWRFSVTVYAHERVKKACLSFQDKNNANVNALLLCCWLAFAVEPVSKASLLKACHSIDDWNQHVSQSLRSTRRWIRSMKKKVPWVEEYGHQLLMHEIVSETYQQWQLFSYFKNKIKKQAMIDQQQAILYLSWLFSEKQGEPDRELAGKIKLFVRRIFSTVSNYE